MVRGKESGQEFSRFRADQVFQIFWCVGLGFDEVLEKEVKLVIGEVATVLLPVSIFAVPVSWWFLVTEVGYS